jgi:hypothetical protein
MRTFLLAVTVTALLCLEVVSPPRAAAQSAPAASPDRALARDLLRELVEIDTSPANGCTKAAEAMAARLRSAGFPDSDVQIAGPRPERRNLVVRLRGRAQAKPVLWIAHLDVVDAPREGWLPGFDPFKLNERDGFFYGRGVLDDKNAAAGLVASLIRLRAEGFIPSRDIIVALTADEETGPANGVTWLLANRRDWIDSRWPDRKRETRAPNRPDQPEDQPELPGGGQEPRRPQLHAGPEQRHLPPVRGPCPPGGARTPLPLQ